MQFTAAEITSFVGSFLWPFFRIGALLIAAPITNYSTVPTRVRLAMAAVLTLVIMPTLHDLPKVDPLSLPSVFIIFQQILIGVAMGFALQLVFSAIVTGGQIVAMQMGLGFAAMVDPQNGGQVPVLSQLYLFFAVLVFLALNGHLILIEVLMRSFQSIPIGQSGIDRNAFHQLAEWGSQMFAGAVWLALPAVASLLVVNIAFGVMARAAPQLNIFAVGFPITLMLGFVVILVVFPTVVPQFTTLVDRVFSLIRSLMGEGG